VWDESRIGLEARATTELIMVEVRLDGPE